MSPTPVTITSPTAPPGYSWEATSEQVAARYGVALADVLRFDLNTAPAAPELAARFLAAAKYDLALSEYPPSDYRRLVAAAAARYGVGMDEILVGAGADEILDITAKAFLAPGAAAVVPVPTYSMYRVLTDQRPARTIAVPRMRPTAGFAIDIAATRLAARDADLVWLCSPNNPTALPERAGAIAALLEGLAADATADRRPAPIVVLDEAYAEFTGTTLVGLRVTYPRLIVVRTASKAYGLAGLRVGFALAVPAVIALMEPYRPPGSVSVVSVEIATKAFESDGWLETRVAGIHRERERFAAGLARLGWLALPSVANFLLVSFGTAERAGRAAEGLLHHGIVPRTFGSTHPLADHLRITVRSAGEDDRFLAAVRQIAAAQDLAAQPATREDLR